MGNVTHVVDDLLLLLDLCDVLGGEAPLGAELLGGVVGRLHGGGGHRLLQHVASLALKIKIDKFSNTSLSFSELTAWTKATQAATSKRATVILSEKKNFLKTSQGRNLCVKLAGYFAVPSFAISER